MRTVLVIIAGLALLACQNPAYPNSGTSYGNSQGTPSGGPPYSVTYRNTTVSTTGTVPVDAASYPAGATVTVLGNTGNLSWPPFTWIGWNTRDNNTNGGGGGGTEYPAGGTFIIQSNVVLYGTWTP